ncbi:lytic transglycosylase catalytic [Fibrella aestuarina BUZ 2]|uniref:Lytic transglycosylase catalytic n=1 Tax=Fibrella aestuarina BUZ 2 TaxID=1166018 RepID=I0K5C3_9BACT|nr:lytic transglycosylase domain-containing protein [Fibrella aestuarina]CCG99326.1 lytic transglycosylase catalytic [Fibrella aestuarina BUZ 2]
MKHLLLATAAGLGLFQSPVVQASPPVRAVSPADDDIRFCGEQLPTYLPTVSQRWQRTIVRRARSTDDLLAIQRQAAAIFPIIEPILEQYGIPKDLKYLALVESELETHALSRKGAAGLWQLMPQTARKMGLSVRRRNDERYDIRKATHAACQYLWALYRQTGSWMLAASAYNAGPSYVAQLTKQYPAEHPLMLPFAKAETQQYVYQALAYKELLTRPAAYDYLLNSQTVLALSQHTEVLSPSERTNILSALETPHPEVVSERVAEMSSSALANSTVLLSNDDRPTEASSAAPVVTPGTSRKVTARPATTPVAAAKIVASEPSLAPHRWPAVQTRSFSQDKVREGQMYVFEVTSAQTIDGQTLQIGDLVYAFIELIEPTSGRIYLRADRVMSSQTRETLPIKLIAVGQGNKPGVQMPLREEMANGWQLAWQKL